MPIRKKIFVIIGSASKDSSNLKLVRRIAELGKDDFEWEIFDRLSMLPHFDPSRTSENTPQEILDFRACISNADGIIICTPEYVFSIPSGLKNAIEWCVSTTVFSRKPIGLITASADGEKGHEELKLIMKTIETVFTDETTLLVRGVKGQIDKAGNISVKLEADLNRFVDGYRSLLQNMT